MQSISAATDGGAKKGVSWMTPLEETRGLLAY